MFEISAKKGLCYVICGSEVKTSDLAAHFHTILALQIRFCLLHLFSLRIGTFSTERGMGQFISAAAFKLRQSFSTSTDFIRIGSRVFIFDRRQWISAGALNFGMDIQ